jgi:predicted adenine nucleotide alpha hydrolase (AANH) superfamily ATPase
MAKEQILLHACCATCAGYVLEKLAAAYTPLIYYCNPNIHPPEEYRLRRDELKNYAQKKNIAFIEEPYHPESGCRQPRDWKTNRKKAAAATVVLLSACSRRRNLRAGTISAISPLH